MMVHKSVPGKRKVFRGTKSLSLLLSLIAIVLTYVLLQWFAMSLHGASIIAREWYGLRTHVWIPSLLTIGAALVLIVYLAHRSHRFNPGGSDRERLGDRSTRLLLLFGALIAVCVVHWVAMDTFEYLSSRGASDSPVHAGLAAPVSGGHGPETGSGNSGQGHAKVVHWRICLILLGLLVAMLYVTERLTEGFRRFIRLHTQRNVKARRVVFLWLSSLGTPKDAKGNEVPFQTLMDGVKGRGLDEYLQENRDNPWSWVHLIRTIKPHRITKGWPERIVLFTSEDRAKDPDKPMDDSNRVDGTHRQLREAKQFIKHFLPKVDIISEPVDFESVDHMMARIEHWVETLCPSWPMRLWTWASDRVRGKGAEPRYRYNVHEIIVDATGGPKLSSIAAALATIRYRNLEFQYVQTSKPNAALAYNYGWQNAPSLEPEAK